ncbi:MAG: peptidylprolyl isomerase [Phycisphaerales bacterium]|nr:MAG: peptidylprolyl isomerase [Phycisphaerales bacterium]
MRRTYTFMAAGSVAVVAAVANGQATDTATTPPVRGSSRPAIEPHRLYNGVNRPLLVNIAGQHSIGTYELALMNETGEILAGPVEVRGGRSDLAEIVPEIWQIRRTCYLQLLDRDREVGSALVLRPMLSRMVPLTETDQRSDGTPYTRIVDWADELAPSPASEEEPATTESPPEGEGGDATAEPPSEAPPDETGSGPSVFSGLCAYVEQEIVLRTTVGDIVLAMCPEEAPNTVWNFLQLCEGGFYNDVTFHRILQMSRAGLPFVIQAGDPTATGDGGPGYWLPIEPSRLPHDYGVISMARADDPDSAGSQFFICLSREGTARLDGQYCAFGYAVEGAATIDAIADSEMLDAELGRAVEPPVILETVLRPAPPHLVGEQRWMRRISVETAEMEKPRPERVPR